MFRFCSLYSGSTGNSLFIESDNTKILVDSGVSLKKLTSALSSSDISLSDINAIIVTHEHSDHVQSLGMVSSKYNIPVYANEQSKDVVHIAKQAMNVAMSKLNDVIILASSSETSERSNLLLFLPRTLSRITFIASCEILI